MASIINANATGAGARFIATPGEDVLVASGIELASTNSFVLVGVGDSTFTLAAGATVMTGAVPSPGSQFSAIAFDGADASQLIISEDANVIAGDAPGVIMGGTATGHRFLNRGSVFGGLEGVIIGGADAEAENHGTLQGSERGIRLEGPDGLTLNYGVIRGAAEGLLMSGAGASVVNHGVIQGSDGVDFSRGGQLTNHGTIEGETAIRLGTFEGNGGGGVLNFGRIIGDEYAISGTGDGFAVVNAGDVVAGLSAVAAIFLSDAAGTQSLDVQNTGSILAPADVIVGGGGGDVVTNSGLIDGDLRFGNGADRYDGSDGRLIGRVFGGDDEDFMLGGDFADVFVGDEGADQLLGKGGDDDLRGGDDGDDLRGGAGDDELRGEAGLDSLRGGLGDDDLDGGNDADALRGGRGDDDLDGGDGADVLRGNRGQDDLVGDEGEDSLYGGREDDVLFGGANIDVLYGGRGDDVLDGGAFSDGIFGGAGDDVLRGEGGFDVLQGGRGDDLLFGGAAADVFVMRRRSDDDEIVGFQNGMDVIDLAAFGLRPAQFAAVVAPALNDAGGGATFLDLTQLGGNGSVLIRGLAFAQADASDFVL